MIVASTIVPLPSTSRRPSVMEVEARDALYAWQMNLLPGVVRL
jgi:hypothetical protein